MEFLCEHHFNRPVTLISRQQSHWHSRYVQEFFHPPRLWLFSTFFLISRPPWCCLGTAPEILAQKVPRFALSLDRCCGHCAHALHNTLVGSAVSFERRHHIEKIKSHETATGWGCVPSATACGSEKCVQQLWDSTCSASAPDENISFGTFEFGPSPHRCLPSNLLTSHWGPLWHVHRSTSASAKSNGTC